MVRVVERKQITDQNASQPSEKLLADSVKNFSAGHSIEVFPVSVPVLTVAGSVVGCVVDGPTIPNTNGSASPTQSVVGYLWVVPNVRVQVTIV